MCDKEAKSSLFITLTYNNNSVPMSSNGLMTLDKRDIQLFFKRLRKRNEVFKYYAVGEYGSKTMRPHYHIIIFGLRDLNNLFLSWMKDGIPIGQIHIGDVKGASIAYTLKYIAKPGKIPIHARDDRNKEFSLMSKNLGINYITDETIRYHTTNLSANKLYTDDGYTIALPKYYRDKLLSDDQKKAQRKIIRKAIEENKALDRIRWNSMYSNLDYDHYQELIKLEEYKKFFNNKRDKI